jgi:hypothetical protein
MLHEGIDVALGRFILASLYDSLGQGSDLLKKTDKGSQLSLWTHMAVAALAERHL